MRLSVLASIALVRNLSVQIRQRAVYQSQQALLLDVICPYIVQMLSKSV